VYQLEVNKLLVKIFFKKFIPNKYLKLIYIMAVNYAVFHGTDQFGREKSLKQDDPEFKRSENLAANSGYMTQAYDESFESRFKSQLVNRIEEEKELHEKAQDKLVKEEFEDEAQDLNDVPNVTKGFKKSLPAEDNHRRVLEKEFSHASAFGKGAGLFQFDRGAYRGGFAQLEYMDKLQGQSLPQIKVGGLHKK